MHDVDQDATMLESTPWKSLLLHIKEHGGDSIQTPASIPLEGVALFSIASCTQWEGENSVCFPFSPLFLEVKLPM